MPREPPELPPEPPEPALPPALRKFAPPARFRIPPPPPAPSRRSTPESLPAFHIPFAVQDERLRRRTQWRARRRAGEAPRRRKVTKVVVAYARAAGAARTR